MNKDKDRKKLGLWLSTSLVTGNMIGSGIFLLPAALAVYGGIGIFGWVFTSIGAIFLALLFARLSRLVTNVGGPYAYAREGFGDFAGFLVVWGYWISIWTGNAAISVAGVGYLSAFFPALKNSPLLSAILAITAIWLFTLVNTRSIKSVGKIQLLTTTLKILPLLALGTIGLLYFNKENFVPMNISGNSNFQAITATAALTLWAFLGLESATIPSDKVKNPLRTIPRATIIGTFIAALIYIAGTAGVMGIIKPGDLSTSAAPFADAAREIWGNWAYYAIAAGAVISCFGALNGWILLQGQFPMAASRDGVFPHVFGRLSKKGVPLFGVLVSSIFASVLVTMNYSKGLVPMFSFIIMLATFATLFPYLLSSLSEVLIMKRNKHLKKDILRTSLLGLPALVYSVWAVIGLGIKMISWGLVLLAAGIPIYFIVRHKSNKR